MACFFFSACSLLWLCFVGTVASAAEAFDALCGWDAALRAERDPVLAAAALEAALVFLKSATGATGAMPFAASGI